MTNIPVKIGEFVIYVEIDSWIPIELAPFLQKGKISAVCVFAITHKLINTSLNWFLKLSTIPFINLGEKKKFNEIEGERIRTMKMRGQLSQGLVLDLKDRVITVIDFQILIDVGFIIVCNKYFIATPVSAEQTTFRRASEPGYFRSLRYPKVGARD